MQIDLALVGGGLANSLIAYRLTTQRPDLRLLLIEQGASLGGNHTWSCHATDLTAKQHRWLGPLVSYSWHAYQVRFPRFARRIDSGYLSLTSDRLHQVVSDVLGRRALLNTAVASVGPQAVVLQGGQRLQARAVVDGRGDPRSEHFVLRYQKFLGQVVICEKRHGLEEPVLMDATVPQCEGYRFVYTLPYSEKLLLIEDTRYSDSPALDRSELRREIRQYANQQRWEVARVVHEEEGILPIVLAGDIRAFWDATTPGVARSGLRAALFHPTTGYSLPEAVNLADELGDLRRDDGWALYQRIRHRSIKTWQRQRFYRMLNRMLFLAGEPHLRYRVLERFYQLPAPLINRFYAGRSTWSDRLRLLVGAPPVPLGAAFRAVFTSSASAKVRGRAASGASGGRR